MLNEETYENFWELFGSIPSLRQPGRSVTEEILEFDHAHPTCAKARLVDKDGNILDVKSMGFNQADRMALLKLLMTDEKKLDNLTIQDWFKEHPIYSRPISGICGRLPLHSRSTAACLSSDGI